MESLVEKLNKVIADIKAQCNNIRPAMGLIIGIINNAIDRNFDARGRYDGSSGSRVNILSGGSKHWEPLSKTTQKSLLSKGYTDLEPTLYRTGRLRQQLEVRSRGSSVIISSNVPYAAIHQYGGWVDIPAHTRTLKFKTSKIKKDETAYNFDKNGKKRRITKSNAKGRNISEQTVNIKARRFYVPARPYIVLSKEDVQEIYNVLLYFVKKR